MGNCKQGKIAQKLLDSCIFDRCALNSLQSGVYVFEMVFICSDLPLSLWNALGMTLLFVWKNVKKPPLLISGKEAPVAGWTAEDMPGQCCPGMARLLWLSSGHLPPLSAGSKWQFAGSCWKQPAGRALLCRWGVSGHISSVTCTEHPSEVLSWNCGICQSLCV